LTVIVQTVFFSAWAGCAHIVTSNAAKNRTLQETGMDRGALTNGVD
jgi:hypothetical protein